MGDGTQVEFSLNLDDQEEGVWCSVLEWIDTNQTQGI